MLRLGLATLVILGHSPELIDGDRRREYLSRLFGTMSLGEVAVDGFFLLSGFLILQSWQRRPALGDFLRKRVLRIYPGFLVASAVAALVVGPLGSNAARYFADFRWLSALKASLLLRVPLVPPVFQGQPHPLVNGAMWTIEYEFRCYLLVALLGVCGLAGRRRLWAALSATALALSISSLPLDQISFRGSSYLVGTPSYLLRFIAFFGAGACFYLSRESIPYKASWALAAAILLAACFFHPITAQVGLLTLGGYVLFWFVFAPLPLLGRFRTYPDISYGVYLYGWPTQKLLLWYIPTLAPWSLFVLTMAVCGGLGWLSWTFVERPCMRTKRSPTEKVAPHQTPVLRANQV